MNNAIRGIVEIVQVIVGITYTLRKLSTRKFATRSKYGRVTLLPYDILFLIIVTQMPYHAVVRGPQLRTWQEYIKEIARFEGNNYNTISVKEKVPVFV